MKNLINAIATKFAEPIAANVRIVDSEAPHCLNADQIVAVARWLSAIAPEWTKIDLVIIGDSPEYNRGQRADNRRYYEFWNEYLDRFAYIFSQQRIPVALTCFERKDYELEEEAPENAPESPWLTNTNILKFKGIPIDKTNAYLSIPTKLEVISAQDILSIF